MQPAPTRPAASNATVHLDGSEMDSNAQILTSVLTGRTSAVTTLTASTPWALIAAPAKRDSLETDSTAQTATSVRRTATCVKAATA